MQVKAWQSVCKATFTRCVSVCSKYTPIFTEVRAKLGLEAIERLKVRFG